MKPNALRGTLAVLFLVAVIAAYLMGKGAGEREARAAAKSASQGSGNSLSGLGYGAGRPGDAGGGDANSNDGAAKQRSVKFIIAKAQAKMAGGMMNVSGMMRALVLLDGIADEQILDALEEIDRTVKGPQQKVMFAMLLLGRWAESDGPGALAYAEENFSSKNPMMMSLKSSVVSSWAQSDPDAAWDWYLDQAEEGDVRSGPFGSGRSMAVMGIISSLATKDVDLAFERLASIEDSQDRQMAMQGLGQAIWDESRRGEILAKIQSMEDPAEKSLARQSVISQWSQIDPEGAIEWSATLDGDEHSEVVKQIAQSLRWSDPERSGDLLLSEAKTPEDRSQAYSNTISSWVNNDPNGAGEWLGNQDQGPELDAARQQFAQSVAGKDPESAMAWANAVIDAEKRTDAVRGVYQQWRGEDQEAADAALGETELSQEKIDELRAGEVPVHDALDGHLHSFEASIPAAEVEVEAVELPDAAE
jgi:hypothetical protein